MGIRATFPWVGLVLAVGCAARPASTGGTASREGVVRGTASYRERMALPPDAVVEVWLRDVSPGMVAQVLLGEASVPAEGRQVPLAFELRYDAGKIDPAHDYAVKAVIQSAGRTLFESAADQPVITKGHPTEVSLWLVRAAPDLQGTTWRLEDSGGAGVVDGTDATLEFPEAGTIAGQGSCNRFFGTAEISGTSIRLGPLGATQMACSDAVMQQETNYLRALRDAERYSIEGDTLLVYCTGLETPLRFVRKQP